MNRPAVSQPAAVVMTNYEKYEDRLSENVEEVKEAKIVKARDYWILEMDEQGLLGI